MNSDIRASCSALISQNHIRRISRSIIIWNALQPTIEFDLLTNDEHTCILYCIIVNEKTTLTLTIVFHCRRKQTNAVSTSLTMSWAYVIEMHVWIQEWQLDVTTNERNPSLWLSLVTRLHGSTSSPFVHQHRIYMTVINCWWSIQAIRGLNHG